MPSVTKVLLVSPKLNYSAATLYTLNLATGLMERGIQPHVVSSGGSFVPVYRRHGIRLSVHASLDRFLVEWLLLRRIGAEVRPEGPELVHAQSALKMRAALALGRRLDVPVVATIHRYADQRGPAIPWRRLGGVITFSEELRADIVNVRKLPKELVRVIPAGVGAASATPAPPPFSREGGVPIVGTLGEIEKVQAQRDFLLAAKDVLEQDPRVQFLIVGEAERDVLRDLIRELDIGRNVTFASSATETSRILRIMDVCVLPSLKEGPGQGILDAMAAGRPVIATGAGGVFSIIRDEETGVLVDKGNPKALASAILRLVGDPELARRLGAEARTSVLESFPMARVIDETLALYEEVVRDRAGAR